MPSTTIQNAIDAQLNERVVRVGDDYLCRRCGNVVPDDFRYVYHVEGTEDTVWGPYCSEECICYAKICSGCNKDFIVDDKSQIRYFGDGKWLCTECSANLVYCAHCNKILENESELVEVAGDKICQDCKERHYFECPECGEWHNKEKMMSKVQDPLTVAAYTEASLWCNDCFLERKNTLTPSPVIKCKRCGDIAGESSSSQGYCHRCISNGYVTICTSCGKLEDVEYILMDGHGNNLCKKCVKKNAKCIVCGKFISKKGSKRVNSYKTHYVCKDCEDKEVMECPSCLKIKEKDSFQEFPMKDGSVTSVCMECAYGLNYCGDCKEFHCGEGECRTTKRDVMNYSYLPRLVFHHGDSIVDKVFFGFENEMNYSSGSSYSKAKEILYTKYKATELYCKSDASIAGSGFEVVSHPMNLSYLRKFPLSYLFEVKTREYDDSCGLHVHVNKESFLSEVHLYKFITMINNGSSTFIEKVAGRSYCGYAKKISGKISSHLKSGAREKYHAVNLRPKDTVEVRIFRRADTEFELRYRIEFVHALIMYTMSTSLTKAGNEEEFKAFVASKKSTYPSLFRFLKKNG